MLPWKQKKILMLIFFVIHKISLELNHVHISKNIRFLKVKKPIRKEDHKTKNRSNRSNKKKTKNEKNRANGPQPESFS
jgi:hypothetical protein